MSDRDPLTCLGHLIGTYIGWDQLDENCQVFYDFEPEQGLPLPGGDLTINYDKGAFEYFNSDGICTVSLPILPTMAKAFL